MSDFVSIVMPVWNTGEYLLESVKSALRELDNVEGEVLCIDDNSTDRLTLDVLKQCQALSSRVRVLVNESGVNGAGAARNYGVKHARGDWLLFLDSDDVFIDGSVAARLEQIRANPEIDWMSADFYNWYPPGEPQGKCYFEGKLESYPSIHKEYHEKRLIVKSSPVAKLFEEFMPAHTLTVMVRTELFNRVGGFATHLRKAEDTFLWINLANADAKFAFYPFPVGKYRIRADSLTHEEDAHGVWKVELYRGFYRNADYARYRPVLRRKVSKNYLSVGNYYVKKRRVGPAIGSSLRAICWWPFYTPPWKTTLAAALISLGLRK